MLNQLNMFDPKIVTDNKQAFFEVYKDDRLENKWFDFYIVTTQEQGKVKPILFNPQKKLCYFTCIGWNQKRFKIVLNQKNGQEAFIAYDTTKYQYIAWQDFLPQIKYISKTKYIQMDQSQEKIVFTMTCRRKHLIMDKNYNVFVLDRSLVVTKVIKREKEKII